MKELGIYVHIPFCCSKCYYCDFNSYVNQLDITQRYVEYIKKEIDLYSDKGDQCSVKTIFFGGGTPSLIDGKYIYEIIEHIKKTFKADSIEEITIECNPKTLDDEKLAIYIRSGVNRISLGLQTLNNKLLKSIGRIHSVEDFYETYSLVRKWGIENVNVDIMFNLPQQSLKDIEDTLKGIIDLGVEHISYYSLKLEENTPFYSLYNKEKLTLPDEETEREMYSRGIDILEENHYTHYEISNFAKKGYECKHNLIYWQVKPYIGLGLSAHSNMDGKRYGNVTSFKDYFEKIDLGVIPIEEEENIDDEMEMAEYMILGLRLMEGVDCQLFSQRFGKDVFELYGEKLVLLERQGLLDISEDRKNISLTKRGFDLSNQVFMELLP